MNVKTNFLNGDLEESGYMMQPDGFIAKGQEHLVCKLHKSIYGLKKIALSQTTYIDKLLVKYVMQDSKKGLLPFRHGVPLSQDQCGGAVSWKSVKQSYIANSTMAVENHRNGKHIERKYHLIRETIMRGDVALEKITSIENLVDPFTKTLSTKVFDHHRDSLDVRCVPSML
ncbi:hypothetical protein AAG906_006771 [Vitis piasezkii]